MVAPVNHVAYVVTLGMLEKELAFMSTFDGAQAGYIENARRNVPGLDAFTA